MIKTLNRLICRYNPLAEELTQLNTPDFVTRNCQNTPDFMTQIGLKPDEYAPNTDIFGLLGQLLGHSVQVTKITQ